ncbi:MAG: flagellar motor protein, partial [Chitinimonas sp.]|nr:flagellar motor protein [Chitinimonas sp.]
MDRLSIIGILLGIAAIVGGQVLEGGQISSLLQVTALLIVMGGTMGAVLLQSNAASFIGGVKMLRWVVAPPLVELE